MQREPLGLDGRNLENHFLEKLIRKVVTEGKLVKVVRLQDGMRQLTYRLSVDGNKVYIKVTEFVNSKGETIKDIVTGWVD